MAKEYGELIDCPFCGMQPVGIYGPHPRSLEYWIECDGVDDNYCGDWYYEAESKQAVADVWNRRAVGKQIKEIECCAECGSCPSCGGPTCNEGRHHKSNCNLEKILPSRE